MICGRARNCMSDRSSNEDLVRAVAAKDTAAFRALYDRMSPKLLTIAIRICGERALAEDALQEAFTEIWRRADAFDVNRGRADAWMAVIARNRSIDSVRRRGRTPSGVEEVVDIQPIEMLADSTKPVDGGADYLALAECLERLDTRSRETVLFAYHLGLTREELSARYDAPQSTIKTWLRRGLEQLRRCLSDSL